MAETNTATNPVKLNTDYKKATGLEVTIMRLSQAPNQFGSYAYALIKGELPKGAKTYGKDGRVIFYTNKMVGGHMVNHVCNVAGVERTSKTTGEVITQVVIMKTEAETKQEASFIKEVQEISKEARAFGMNKQQVGQQYFAAKFGAKFASTGVVAQVESAEA